MKLFLLVLCLIICACSNSQEFKNPKKEDLAEGIPPHLRAKTPKLDEELAPVLLPDEEATTAALSQPAAGSILPALPDASDLIWTDPDNPDQNLGSVESAFTQPVKDVWQLSYRSAQRLAYTEGKALVLWFTDSVTSPTCKLLGRELLGTKPFEQWCDQHVVKLRVDTSPTEPDRKLKEKKRKYALALRKKFRVKGSPTIIVLGPEGETLGRYTGYKSGESAYYWGRLKNAVRTADKGVFDWRVKMKGKGYRIWAGENGVELFAKLLKYREGMLLLAEPNGRKTKVKESNLSAKDKAWIAQKKVSRSER